MANSTASVSLLIDFSNGATKSFGQIGLQGAMSVTQALDAAAHIDPGLAYEFDEEFTDRGGRRVGTLKSVDGVGETETQEWGVWLNGRVIGELRQVIPESISSLGSIELRPGDSILLKLVERSEPPA